MNHHCEHHLLISVSYIFYLLFFIMQLNLFDMDTDLKRKLQNVQDLVSSSNSNDGEVCNAVLSKLYTSSK